MKKLFLVLLVVAALGGSMILSLPAEAVASTKPAHVVAYYFHGSFRCPTCHKLEQYSREAIESNFKDAIASGKLEYKVVNVEEKSNEHYAREYQLYTKSLILSLVVNGKETKWINLNKIWEYVGNKGKFIDYVKNGVADLLKETS